ncbi:MAG: hypothetical protein MUE65_01265 [Methanomassiliicoccales archaeon]|jgi:hypothetical protein|nr:hypothetical protein [Methanomassiliicoccales archaeon]
MRGLVDRATVLVLVGLIGIGAVAALLSGSLERSLALAVANAALFAAYGWGLRNARQSLFSLAAGAALVMNVAALAYLSGLGLAGTWAGFGIGLVAIMAGDHTCRSRDVLGVRRDGRGETEDALQRAALRGYLRILLFGVMVMAVSLFLLLLALNAQLGSMPSWAFAALALAAMVAIAILARSRHAEG